ncbi:MAG: hypothetical protein HQ564_01510, partial [Candidatus Saganbacteria bacterium]|nr:hypothetical protein [Candidatus Saganbacteria bacterium]
MPKITGSYLFNNWKSWVGLRSAGPIKLTNIQSIPNWKKEWGAEKPGSDEITAANKATETVLRLYGSIESSRAAAYILVETNIKALYLANRDAAITTLAYYRGNHEGLAVYLRKNTTPAFWAELIGPLLNEDAKYASGAISLLDMLFYSIPQKEEIGPFFVDHGLAKSLLEWVSTSEPHKLTSDFGSLLPKLLLMANKVLKTCIEQEDNKIWKSLSEETREKLLTYNETVSNANLLKKRVDKAHTTWKKEWGEGPDDRAIVKAKKELKIIRETFGGTKSSLSANSLADGVDLVDIRALYLVDKEAAIDTLAYMSGCHTTIAGLLRLDTTPAFWAELIGPLLKKDAKHASGALALLNMLFNSNQQKDKFGPFFVDHGLAKPLLEWIGRAKPGELGTHHETLILMASKILKTCLERKDIKIWESLSDETREKLFTHNETVVNADLLNIEAMRNRADEAHSAWNEEAWGYAPLDEEIERARDWIENTVKQDGFNIHSPELAHSSFRNGIDFVALFLIDKELYKLLIGNSFGRHNDISGRLKGQTLSFWAETLKLILEDDIAPAKDYDTAICYLTNAMLVHQRVILGKLTELLPIIAEHNLEEPILRQAKFLRYITNMTARGGFVNLLKIIFKFGVSETDKLVKIWQKLPEESRQALLKIKGIEKEAQEIHDAWEGSSTETETKIKWKEEWGAAPTEKQIAAAKEWADKIRASNMELRSRNLASRALTDKVNLKALWLIDPGLLRILMVFCAGSHQKIGDQLGYNDSLWAELTRFLLESKHEPPANDHEAGQEYLSGTIKYLSKMISSNYNEFMAFIKKNNLYEPFLRQAPYLKHITRFATAFFGPICEAGLEHLIENDQAEEVWKSLSEKARQGLLEDEHTERLAIQIQKACQQREEYSSNEFEAFQKAIIEIEPKLLHEKSKVNYSKEIAQKFYELIPKEERGRALAAMDQETAGLIVRSAKGIHGPIGRAVNDMPTQAAVELLERELKLVPNDLIKNREMAHTFRDTDNFGAFKCFLVRKELGEGVSYQDLSLLWTELSLDGKADFFRVLHIYSILVDEVSTNETLIPNLASKIKRSSINEQREIYNACSKEVQTFLKERKIVNLEEPKKTDEPAPSEKYLPALQQEFDTTNNTKAERANAFSFLWHEDRETAARLIRTVKFHEIARDMLSDLDDTELAQVLDTSLVDAPKFSDQTAVKRFDQLDSSVVVRGLCLLPQEKAEGALNLVKDETLARVFDRAFVVCGGVLTPARSRSYVHNLLSQALRSGQVDQEKVAKALQSCQRRTIAWVRGIYRGKLDISVARAKAERLIEKDPMAQRIIKAKIKTHRMARQILEIAGAAVSKQEPHFTQLMLPSLQDAEGDAVFALKNELSKDAVRKIGILYDAVRENEKLAAQQ